MIDARLVPDKHEELTPGEAVAGMRLHGWGFAQRPLSLTPQVFPNTPLARLCRPGVQAEMGNRLQLGRTLDEVHGDGCDLLWSELALASWTQERIAQRFPHLDTPSFSLRGRSVPERDTQAMRSTHGSAKAHRPDLTQVV
jgi:transposase